MLQNKQQFFENEVFKGLSQTEALFAQVEMHIINAAFEGLGMWANDHDEAVPWIRGSHGVGEKNLWSGGFFWILIGFWEHGRRAVQKKHVVYHGESLFQELQVSESWSYPPSPEFP